MELEKNIKGIIFDLDGTLFRLNVNWAELRSQIETITGEKIESFNEFFQSAVSSKRTKINELVDEAESQGVLTGESIPGVIEAMKQLAKYYKLAVVTRNSRRSALLALGKLNLANIPLVAREDVAKLKPHPEGITLALERMEVSPEAAVVVGDTYHDVEAAHNLGMKCIIIRNSDLQSIPASDFVVENFEELEQLLAGVNKHND